MKFSRFFIDRPIFAIVISVITVVLAFNFLGDGLRDAADPYGI